MKRYEEVIKSADEEWICRILEVVSIVCSVRQGSRMSRTYFLLFPPPLAVFRGEILSSAFASLPEDPSEQLLRAAFIRPRVPPLVCARVVAVFSAAQIMRIRILSHGTLGSALCHDGMSRRTSHGLLLAIPNYLSYSDLSRGRNSSAFHTTIYLHIMRETDYPLL